MRNRLKIGVIDSGCPWCEHLIWRIDNLASHRSDIKILDIKPPLDNENADKPGANLNVAAIHIDDDLDKNDTPSEDLSSLVASWTR